VYFNFQFQSKDLGGTINATDIRFGEGWMNTMYRQPSTLAFPYMKKQKEYMEKDTVKEYMKKRTLILELLAQEVRTVNWKISDWKKIGFRSASPWFHFKKLLMS